MATFTNRLNLAKPAGGSSGTIPGDDQADIDVLNANSDKIDAAVGVRYVTSTTRPSTPFDGQVIRETDTGQTMIYRQGTSQWESVDSVEVGNTALRDLIYGTPAAGAPGAAARIALANRFPRFFNTDKGYTQSYFAQFDDAGVGTTTPTKTTPGWGPSVELTEIPISTFTVSGAGMSKRGGMAFLSSAQTVMTIDGCFNSDFEAYKIVVEIPLLSSGSGDVVFGFRNGGADDVTTNYDYTRFEVTNAGTSSAANVTAGTNWQVGRATNGGPTRIEIVLHKPGLAEWKVLRTTSVDNDRYQRFFGGIFRNAVTRDGFKITAPGAMAIATKIRIYGINDY